MGAAMGSSQRCRLRPTWCLLAKGRYGSGVQSVSAMWSMGYSTGLTPLDRQAEPLAMYAGRHERTETWLWRVPGPIGKLHTARYVMPEAEAQARDPAAPSGCKESVAIPTPGHETEEYLCNQGGRHAQ